MLHVVLGVLLPSPCHCTARRWSFGCFYVLFIPLTGTAALALLMETAPRVALQALSSSCVLKVTKLPVLLECASRVLEQVLLTC